MGAAFARVCPASFLSGMGRPQPFDPGHLRTGYLMITDIILNHKFRIGLMEWLAWHLELSEMKEFVMLARNPDVELISDDDATFLINYLKLKAE